ncbi:MAG TPA: sigma-54 dependent transcriptional regulator [Pyrinomonadaceae bacterium]|nr:sigma-54 dependent transcriptional regulator [Pyrinomonadaceae bacterium]
MSERILSQIALDKQIEPNQLGGLRGASMKIRELYSDIEKLARLSETVLLIGETGTGKELVARELHNRSGRTGPYTPINCPEISPELISSELFGHVKGAFTGADKTRPGLIASAANGTVFLDEIGDLDLPSQSKLLRVLEDRTIRKVGANVFESVNARIVLATNRNLKLACDEGTFRVDLYERIRGFKVDVPPLRTRKSDIPLLAHHFVSEYDKEYNTAHRIADASVDCLFRYDWPGNVRELRGVIRRATAYADANGFISAWVLQESVRTPEAMIQSNAVPFDPAVDSWMDIQNRAERAYFSALLAHTGGKRDAAMKRSGLHKTQFFAKLKKLSNPQD